MLILHFEPPHKAGKPPPSAAPDVWAERITRALEVPQAFAEFLWGELHSRPWGQPPVRVAVLLEAQRDLAEMIDITSLHSLPAGGNRVKQAVGYFLADSGGSSAGDAASRMVGHVLLHDLSVDYGG
jgi:hypothetical protein